MNAGTQFLVVSVCLAATVAEAGTIVIDDFTDAARVELPGGPELVVTPNVGDLNAERSFRISKVGDPNAMPIGRADINSTARGEFFVDMDDAGDTTFVSAHYRFSPYDFSQHQAIILDVSLWPVDPIDSPVPVPPALMVTARESVSHPFEYTFVRDLPRGVGIGRLVLPLDSFTNRGGGPAEGDWSAISRVSISIGAAGGFGSWEVALDRISVGPAIPEPSTFCLLTACVGWLVLPRSSRRSERMFRKIGVVIVMLTAGTLRVQAIDVQHGDAIRDDPVLRCVECNDRGPRPRSVRCSGPCKYFVPLAASGYFEYQPIIPFSFLL